MHIPGSYTPQSQHQVQREETLVYRWHGELEHIIDHCFWPLFERSYLIYLLHLRNFVLAPQVVMQKLYGSFNINHVGLYLILLTINVTLLNILL